MVAMKSGKDSRTVCVDYEPTFQKGGGNAKVRRPEITAKNIAACNGVVHLLDGVMLPNGFQEYEEAAALNASFASRSMQGSGLFALAFCRKASIQDATAECLWFIQ